MEKKTENTEKTMIDNKFSIALRAIETAQHQVRAGQEVNLTQLLDEVKKTTTQISYS